MELATVVAAPTAGRMLCAYGAEVIKVENPKLFLREGGAWRLVLGDGAHCFGSCVGSDV